MVNPEPPSKPELFLADVLRADPLELFTLFTAGSGVLPPPNCSPPSCSRANSVAPRMVPMKDVEIASRENDSIRAAGPGPPSLHDKRGRFGVTPWQRLLHWMNAGFGLTLDWRQFRQQVLILTACKIARRAGFQSAPSSSSRTASKPFKSNVRSHVSSETSRPSSSLVGRTRTFYCTDSAFEQMYC